MKKIIVTAILAVAFAAAFCMNTAAAESVLQVQETSLAQNAAVQQPDITSFGAYMTDFYTGKVMYAKNENARHEIASMVKIMTANLVFEEVESGRLSYDEEITVSEEAAGMGGSQMFLDAGVKYRVDDLIKGVIVASANDASVALAERISGSHEAFVAQMNVKAQEWGMSDTLFSCATGLPDSGEQYSTARDVNVMTRKLMAHDKYFEYAGIWMEDFTHPGGRVTQLVNTNKLIRNYSGCMGGKTGYTQEAGFCLSACAQRQGVKVVATLIGGTDGKTRFAEVSRMFNYAFANYKTVTLYPEGSSVGVSVRVKGGKSENVDAVVSSQISVLMANGEANPEVITDVPEYVKAPVRKGDKIGTVTVKCADGQVISADLVSPCDVDKCSIWDYIRKVMG